MPRVRVKVQLEADTAQDPVALEEAIAAEGRRAARELYAQVIEEADRRLVAASGGAQGTGGWSPWSAVGWGRETPGGGRGKYGGADSV